MFNIGPLEFVVLALVGLIVLGPDKLPSLARDAAQMLKTLREMATGARQQLRDELGPEFADVDLRTLNPRTAVTRAVFGDEFDPRASMRDAVFGPEAGSLRDDLRAIDPRSYLRPTGEPAVSMEKPVSRPVDPHANATANGATANGTSPNGAPRRPRPRPSPGPSTSYDSDAT